jgi:hypothetical protein
MKINANKQTLLEFAEHIATTKHGARWAGHNYVYLVFQRQVFNFIESCETFNALPAAFSNRKELILWATTNGQNISPVGHDISWDHALLTTGTSGGPPMLDGQPFIWVRAKSSLYRKALFAWMDTQVTKNYQSLHQSASEYCQSVAMELRQKTIRKNIPEARRQNLAKEFDELSSMFFNSSKTQSLAEINKNDLKLLDQSLDADHVINRQSLRLLPDAWVMIAPVIAGTNRSFGRMIEQKAAPFPPSTKRITLDAITALKLHAPSIPTCEKELLVAIENLKKSLISSPGLAQELTVLAPTLTGIINGTIKSFVR